MDGQAKVRKRSTLSWIMEFAGSRRGSYALSVLLAILSVARAMEIRCFSPPDRLAPPSPITVSYHEGRAHHHPG